MHLNGRTAKTQDLKQRLMFSGSFPDWINPDKRCLFFLCKLAAMPNHNLQDFFFFAFSFSAHDRPMRHQQKCASPCFHAHNQGCRTKRFSLIYSEPPDLFTHCPLKFSPIPRMKKRLFGTLF